MERSLFDSIITALKHFPTNTSYNYSLTGGGLTAYLTEQFFDREITIKDVDIEIFSYDCPSFYIGNKVVDIERYKRSNKFITEDFISFLSYHLINHRVEFSPNTNGVEGISIDGERCIDLLVNQADETNRVNVGGINISNIHSHIYEEEMAVEHIDADLNFMRKECLNSDPEEREELLGGLEEYILKKVRLEERRPYLEKLKEIMRISTLTTRPG